MKRKLIKIADKILTLEEKIAHGDNVVESMEEMEKMIQSIPNHRLLCETDAPYLAPVPMRGKTNTPILVEHTYNFVAACKKMPVEELSNLVDKNIKDLFKI